ncbi:XdhC family protein [Serinibacter arcticus]|uniref:XdhC family protein n=1 Tax=Serinibacter arcticus TaxID=1655435 RepID=UPI0011B289EB|nr:XdhC family protein [Serinibacter arcticus]
MIAALEDVVADRPAAVGIVRSGEGAGRVVALDVVAHPAHATAHPTRDLLVLTHTPRPRLVVLGAGEHAVALCRLAAAAGFAVTVGDASALMATRERFPDADRVVVGEGVDVLAALPSHALGPRTAVCVLTHDVRVDVPALAAALALPVGFVGAMGSRSTVARRARLLREAGVDESALARLRSPIGLDLGGTSELETALSILAEIVAVRHTASARPLSRTAGRLHGAPPSPTAVTPASHPASHPACTTTNGAVA